MQVCKYASMQVYKYMQINAKLSICPQLRHFLIRFSFVRVVYRWNWCLWWWHRCYRSECFFPQGSFFSFLTVFSIASSFGICLSAAVPRVPRFQPFGIIIWSDRVIPGKFHLTLFSNNWTYLFKLRDIAVRLIAVPFRFRQ